MKILYLVNSLDVSSGWGRFSRELIQRFAKSGIEVHIFSEIASGYPNEHVVLKRSWKAVTIALRVRRYIKENKIDIVHSFELNPYAITADIAVFGLNVKHVITATGAYSVRPLYQNIIKYFAAHAYSCADKVLCISAYIKEEIQKKLPLNNIEVITLGVDQDKFFGSREVSDEAFILSVGNFGPRKGYEVSIVAFAKVSKKFPDLKYYIAGSVNENNKKILTKLLHTYNLENKVVFLGSQDDMALRKLYLSAKLFILTAVNIDYHFEGFGLVFLEAASAGLPVIGTYGNGIADAMLNNKNGFLVPQNDVDATADALLQILGSPQLTSEFALASIEWARQNSWERVADKYIQVYGKLNNTKNN